MRIAANRPRFGTQLLKRLTHRQLFGEVKPHPLPSHRGPEPFPDLLIVELQFRKPLILWYFCRTYATTPPRGGLGISQIEEFARERLANYKIPKRFVIRDELPEVEVGKVDRVRLSREAENEWGRAGG